MEELKLWRTSVLGRGPWIVSNDKAVTIGEFRLKRDAQLFVWAKHMQDWQRNLPKSESSAKERHERRYE